MHSEQLAGLFFFSYRKERLVHILLYVAGLNKDASGGEGVADKLLETPVTHNETCNVVVTVVCVMHIFLS